MVSEGGILLNSTAEVRKVLSMIDENPGDLSPDL